MTTHASRHIGARLANRYIGLVHAHDVAADLLVLPREDPLFEPQRLDRLAAPRRDAKSAGRLDRSPNRRPGLRACDNLCP